MTSKKWTTADIPNQTGRTAVITGANTGLGFETAAALAKHGAHVVLAVRNLDKGQQAADRIIASTPNASISVQRLDLGSLASIRVAASEMRENFPRIDMLINNAGVMWTPKSTTQDGFELQFGTNHLGHFALTGLLLEHMMKTPDSRVVTVSSTAHRLGRATIHFDDLQSEKKYSRVGAYGQSKLANLLFAYELQRRLAGKGSTISVAAHPGGASTELARNSNPIVKALFDRLIVPLFAQDAAQGALPSLRAATDPQVTGGQYYGPDGISGLRGYPKIVESSAQSYDPEMQRRLWNISEKLSGITYAI